VHSHERLLVICVLSERCLTTGGHYLRDTLDFCLPVGQEFSCSFRPSVYSAMTVMKVVRLVVTEGCLITGGRYSSDTLDLSLMIGVFRNRSVDGY